MDADRWARIQELFLGALERPAGERERYLSDLEDDDEVVEKARQLLAADLDPATVLEGSAGSLASVNRDWRTARAFLTTELRG